jgi:hypothetical protein
MFRISELHHFVLERSLLVPESTLLACRLPRMTRFAHRFEVRHCVVFVVTVDMIDIGCSSDSVMRLASFVVVCLAEIRVTTQDRLTQTSPELARDTV